MMFDPDRRDACAQHLQVRHHDSSHHPPLAFLVAVGGLDSHHRHARIRRRSRRPRNAPCRPAVSPTTSTSWRLCSESDNACVALRGERFREPAANELRVAVRRCEDVLQRALHGGCDSRPSIRTKARGQRWRLRGGTSTTTRRPSRPARPAPCRCHMTSATSAPSSNRAVSRGCRAGAVAAQIHRDGILARCKVRHLRIPVAVRA